MNDLLTIPLTNGLIAMAEIELYCGSGRVVASG